MSLRQITVPLTILTMPLLMSMPLQRQQQRQRQQRRQQQRQQQQRQQLEPQQQEPLPQLSNLVEDQHLRVPIQSTRENTKEKKKV